MKKSFLLVALGCATLGFGCTTDIDVRTSDFTPPTTKAANPPPASAGERRLLTATSTDGVHFTPTGTVFTEQGNVPDVVIADDGTLYVYYVAQGIEAGKETTPVAISSNNGVTWTYHLLQLNGWPSNKAPSDPDVVILDDGTFRMYYTTNVEGKKLGIAYADSEDGIVFTYKGPALSAPFTVIDSSTMYFDGTWHMFVLDEKKPQQYHATSTDGKTFTLASTSPISPGKPGYIISNPTFENDTMRMFGFSLGEKNIRSFTTTDAATWTADDIALDATAASTLGSNYIQDMTVAELTDGTYLMVYVTEYAD